MDANGVVLGTPERAGLRAVQTPQGFATDLLLRAYQSATEFSGAEFTDDASLVEHVGGQVQVVDGDPLAFKITTRLDLLLARAIVRAVSWLPRVGVATRRAPDRTRAAVLAGGPAVPERRRLRWTLRR